jgi:hypothetical protein
VYVFGSTCNSILSTILVNTLGGVKWCLDFGGLGTNDDFTSNRYLFILGGTNAFLLGRIYCCVKTENLIWIWAER